MIKLTAEIKGEEATEFLIAKMKNSKHLLLRVTAAEELYNIGKKDIAVQAMRKEIETLKELKILSGANKAKHREFQILINFLAKVETQ